MSEDKTAKFLPFHAINEFMTDEYRDKVIRTTIEASDRLTPDQQSKLNQITRKYIQIPGFRNSQKAPPSLKVREMISAFKKNPRFVATILSAWASLKGDLNQKVTELLIQRGWEVLPPEMDKTKLPGFLTVWPEGDDFESLTTAFKEQHPQELFEDNDISLLIVWLSNRLPYETSSDLFSLNSGD
jgi:hypothetical protein